MSRSLALLAVLVASAPSLALGAPGVSGAPGESAASATDNCPDGWFCEPSRPTVPPQPDARPLPPEPFAEPPPPPPEPDIRLERPDDFDWEPPPEQREHRRPRHVFQHREWGLNLHLNQALIGHDSRQPRDSGMGGFGFGLRYRMIPHFALETSAEWVWGRDYQGLSRNEAAVLTNAMLFFNPRDPVQVYTFGGLGVGAADVKRPLGSSDPTYAGGDRRYWYLGVQAGIGVDIRINRHVAITTDILGILRGRVDDNANRSPEFVDPSTHRVTNSSGAGLFRLGATFYW